MSGERDDRSRSDDGWLSLCQQASTEQDPQKLLQLVQEINRLLEAKEARTRRDSRSDPAA